MVGEIYDVFVSYSRADVRHAAEIASALRANGLSSFFDCRNLAPGLPWVRWNRLSTPRKRSQVRMRASCEGKPGEDAATALTEVAWSNGSSRESVIAEDFAELRKAALTHPMMVKIENELGISR